MEYLSAHSAESKQRIKRVSELAHIRHSTSPATKLCACLSLPAFHLPCTSQCYHSTHTQPIHHPRAHRANSTDSFNRVSSHALCHTFPRKAAKQIAYLLHRMKYTWREKILHFFLQKNVSFTYLPKSQPKKTHQGQPNRFFCSSSNCQKQNLPLTDLVRPTPFTVSHTLYL